MDVLPPEENKGIETIPEETSLGEVLNGPKYTKYGRFVFAALGSIPWIGGLIGASAALQAEAQQGRVNNLIREWLEEHRQRINQLGATLKEMTERLDQLGESVDERLKDDNYLDLVRLGFRIWDEANANSKREYVRRTLTNAASTRICSDGCRSDVS